MRKAGFVVVCCLCLSLKPLIDYYYYVCICLIHVAGLKYIGIKACWFGLHMFDRGNTTFFLVKGILTCFCLQSSYTCIIFTYILFSFCHSASGPGRCKINNGGCWHESREGHAYSACLVSSNIYFF